MKYSLLFVAALAVASAGLNPTESLAQDSINSLSEGSQSDGIIKSTERGRKLVQAFRRSDGISIDGKLDEAAWQTRGFQLKEMLTRRKTSKKRR